MSSFCAKCGALLSAYQIDVARIDAGYGLDETGVDTMRFACSGYSDDKGCEGNDPDETACWWADDLLDEGGVT
jgi:hypothetical protein